MTENVTKYILFLIPHEAVHLCVALLLSLLVYQWYRSFRLVVLLILVTLFMDADHLFDCWMAFGFNFGLAEFFSGKYWGKTDSLFVPLHSWEILPVIWLFFWWKKRIDIGLTITLAIVGHILVDQFTYAMHPLAYSLIYRAVHGFRSFYFTSAILFQ